MKLWNRVRLIKLFIQLLGNPNRTDLIFKGVEIASSDPKQTALQRVVGRVFGNPEFEHKYDQNYQPDAPQISYLKSCPEGSFGQALYRHMADNGLDFSLWPRSPSRRPVDYLSMRIYQDHDLWHTLLKCGISIEDELAVQAFALGQLQSPIALLLIAGGIIHLMFKDSQRALLAFAKVNENYRLGKQAPLLLSLSLHSWFEQPVEEIRERCGLTRINRAEAVS